MYDLRKNLYLGWKDFSHQSRGRVGLAKDKSIIAILGNLMLLTSTHVVGTYTYMQARHSHT